LDLSPEFGLGIRLNAKMNTGVYESLSQGHVRRVLPVQLFQKTQVLRCPVVVTLDQWLLLNLYVELTELSSINRLVQCCFPPEVTLAQ
jgi:hypothetical protein